MGKVLIAYNNNSETVLHDFFESCADEAKQICFDNGIDYSAVCPPDLNEQNVISVMPELHLCFLVGHGDADGIYNEKGEPVVSTRTTNYNFNGKGFYSIACSCAQNLQLIFKYLFNTRHRALEGGKNVAFFPCQGRCQGLVESSEKALV